MEIILPSELIAINDLYLGCKTNNHNHTFNAMNILQFGRFIFKSMKNIKEIMCVGFPT
jgi:hypothetical protein